MARAKRHYLQGYICHLTHRCHIRASRILLHSLSVLKAQYNVIDIMAL